MQPARMDKVPCFSSNVFILQKTNLVWSEMSVCVCSGPDSEKSASGWSLTQYLSQFCITALFQHSLKYSGFINPFRTTRCSPKGMKPAALSILPYENFTEYLKLGDWSLQLL